MRAALAIAAVYTCLGITAVSADDQVRVRAGLCEDKKCMKRTAIGFAPVRVNVQVYVKPHADNRALIYGLVCDGEWIQESRVQLDGEVSGPLFIAEYRDVGQGECVAIAAVYRSVGEPLTARSSQLLIQARLEDPS